MSGKFVYPLKTKHDSLEIIGGKGRSLARMANAGFAVPDGFQVTTSAYKNFVSENELQVSIIDLARPEIINATVSFKKASWNIQQLFDNTDLSEEFIS